MSQKIYVGNIMSGLEIERVGSGVAEKEYGLSVLMITCKNLLNFLQFRSHLHEVNCHCVSVFTVVVSSHRICSSSLSFSPPIQFLDLHKVSF